jgi:NarL family two-component system response regulator LiaR
VRVVVVDDHPLLRAVLRQMLALHEGVTVVGEAADGEEAVGVVERLRPDAVVMDYRMPGMDGAEATRRIRSSWPGVRVVAFSSSTDVDAVAAMLEAGAGAYIAKGAPGDQVLAALRGDRLTA